MAKDDMSSEINKIKEFAKEENIPIIQDEGIEFLTSFIAKKNIQNILVYIFLLSFLFLQV